MRYQEAMQMLSQCGLGAMLVSADCMIREINETGNYLLRSTDSLAGKRMPAFAEALCGSAEKPQYVRSVFGEYLMRCPTPETVDLPEDTQLIVFREASKDACHDMLLCALNQITEAVVLCDEEERIYYINDAAVCLDSLLTDDILGAELDDVYTMLDGKEMAIPQVIRNRRPILNHRQHYSTRYGREVTTVSNTYPILKNEQVLGAVNVLQDWSQVDSLNKQIIDLQDKLSRQSTRDKNRTDSALTADYHFEDIVHNSDVMNNIITQCRQLAKSDSSVMIYGETGTGKELFAQSIHNASRRAKQPFLAINCAAIPENLLEGLLFGSEKGAFTGAESRIGLFEQANGGTLLLDEINSMAMNLQSKLLRVLQEGRIRRIGGLSEIRVDVRVISNTNIPPYQAIEEGKLRRDLYYRLGVVNINVPPLRDRTGDIELLAKRFVLQYNKKLVRSIEGIDAETLELFSKYSWPGNVRELQHAIEHAMNILPDACTYITPAYIPEHIRVESSGSRPAVRVSRQTAPRSSERRAPDKTMERRTICRVLWENGGNISKSARVLQISRQNLQYRIKRFQIDVAELMENGSPFS